MHAPQPLAKSRWSGCQIGCLLLAAGGLCALLFTGAMCSLGYDLFNEPREAAHEHLNLIREGKHDEAYKRSATHLRDHTTLDAWDRLRSDPLMAEIAASDDATFHRTNIANDRGCMEGTLSPSGGKIYVTLRHEDDRWRVAGTSRTGCDP